MSRAVVRRTGSTLLEVIAALAIVGVVGSAIISLAIDVGAHVRRAHENSMRVFEADAFLNTVVLWTRADLDRHLGERIQGRWRMRVNRSSPTVYDIDLRDSSATSDLLQTSVFRADSASDASVSH